MNINKLHIDLHYVIMEYLYDNPIIYGKLNYNKLEKYKDIYKEIMKYPNKAYIISGESNYKRKTRIDYQIYQFSNYMYLSKKELLSDYNGESPAPTYLRKKMNTINIFIYEVIKIFLNKNILQSFYPGKITDVMINIEDKKYSLYEKINNDTIVDINSFS